MLLSLQKPDAVDGALVRAAGERVGSILVLPSAFFASRIPQMVALAAQHRLPAMPVDSCLTDRIMATCPALWVCMWTRS